MGKPDTSSCSLLRWINRMLSVAPDKNSTDNTMALHDNPMWRRPRHHLLLWGTALFSQIAVPLTRAYVTFRDE